MDINRSVAQAPEWQIIWTNIEGCEGLLKYLLPNIDLGASIVKHNLSYRFETYDKHNAYQIIISETQT